MTDGVMLRLDNMTQILNVDGEAGQVHVQAGATLHDFCRELHSYGLALPNLGDIDVQSIAGDIDRNARHGLALKSRHQRRCDDVGEWEGRNCRTQRRRSPNFDCSCRCWCAGIVCEVVLQCVPSFDCTLTRRSSISTISSMTSRRSQRAQTTQSFSGCRSSSVPGETKPAHH